VSESAGQQPLSTDGKIAIEAKTVGEPAGSPVRAADEVPATPESTASESAERLLAEHAGELPSSPAAATAAADWPGFRGPDRDGIARGVRIETDWSQSPPVELWRRPVGPGWSSLAVRGNLVYTQEQRGDDEVVACYNLTTGEPVWRHRDGARFWESNAGAGPRSTPTLANGRVYSFGATGILNALDARSGAVLWSRNAAADTGVKVPYWGFASSPLVDDDLVIAAAAGQLAAYDLASGEPRWTGPAHGDSYSSPHRLTIGGVPQIVLLSRAGATSVAPADGTLLWEYAWEGFTSLQPAQADDGEVLLATSGDTGGLGMRRLAVTNQEPAGQGSGLPNQMANGRGEPAAQGPGKPVEKASSLSRTLAQASAKPVAPGTGQPSPATPGPWTVAERWTSPGLKPYFNDFVVHQGHAYGFDGRILSCIDLADGQRQWKGGRYGNGQLVLLADQDVLLVLSDEGELALVAATPGKFTELARFRAIEGKTWNHPALAGDILLVRNDQEMAAFRLARARR
jgi:outer membrane protein assembly factor BamB